MRLLGISREALRDRVRAERARRGGSGTTSTDTKDVPVSGATRQEPEAEIAALRAELEAVRKENQKRATLHKSTNFFTQEMSW